ncbi:SPFH domain-containing protein [Ureibacillus manganicus]|uniref:SPFH domain-containing protein n=1 Tax=Ureibacillus manganicus TaxID=1266064 RepID=UPI0022874186|nr:SPFH domain-containing protein [Ureibacillus manganicus]
MGYTRSDPIQIIDPKYHIRLRIRSYGQLALRLEDPLLFFKEIIVSLHKDDIVDYDKVQDYFKGMLITNIKTSLANKMIKEKISALDITAEIPSITNDLKLKIAEEFKLFGFELINFHIQSINFPDEDFDQINVILKEIAQMEMLGEERYEKKRSYDIYEKAASNYDPKSTFHTQLDKRILKSSHTKFCPSCNGTIPSTSKYCFLCGVKIDTKIKCPSCNYENEGNSKFCSICGTDLTKRICQCGNELQSNDQFCPYCGKKVDKSVTE